uniref:Uncharacterized protein n=1 Tax=Peronospora matthiolae TaxID=2874970 RepID=A0AAV1U1L2_9STRA
MKSKRCEFYEKALKHEHIVQLRDNDVLTAQEQLVGGLISSAASDYGLEIAGRSKFACQAPTDFVVLRLFYCNLKASRGGSSNAAEATVDHSVCLGFESVMHDHVKTKARGRP